MSTENEMTEHYESQKKPKSRLRQALIELEDKANPRRANLTKEEQTRIEKLTDIVARLKRRENVQNRQLKTWLTDDEFATIEAEWQEQRALREELKDKPSELKRYEAKFRKAAMMRNRADAYHRKGRKAAASHLTQSAKVFAKMRLRFCRKLLLLIQA